MMQKFSLIILLTVFNFNVLHYVNGIDDDQINFSRRGGIPFPINVNIDREEIKSVEKREKTKKIIPSISRKMLENIHQANENSKQLEVEYKWEGKRNIYKFMNADSALRLAEMLVRATLFAQTDKPELEELRDIFHQRLELPAENRGLTDIKQFFESLIIMNGSNAFDDLISEIIKEFDGICKFEKLTHPDEKISRFRICLVAKKWLNEKIEIYSIKSEYRLDNLQKEYDDKIDKFDKIFTKYNKKMEDLKIFYHNKVGEKPPEMVAVEEDIQKTEQAMKVAETNFVNKCEENAITMSRILYYNIYKHALAYALISEGMPTMKNLKDVNALTTYKPGMTKGRYLIYWLNTIMNQIYPFELHKFDPIKEKEKDVDLSKMKIAFDNYNLPAATATELRQYITDLIAGRLAASPVVGEGSVIDDYHGKLGNGNTIFRKRKRT